MLRGATITAGLALALLIAAPSTGQNPANPPTRPQLAPATPPNPPASRAPTPSPPAKQQHDGLPLWAITVGAATIVSAIVGILEYIRRRREKSGGTSQESQADQSSQVSLHDSPVEGGIHIQQIAPAVTATLPAAAAPPEPAPSVTLAPSTQGFVGREEELGNLGALYDRRSVMVVTGHSGIGKTWLVWELLERRRLRQHAFCLDFARFPEPLVIESLIERVNAWLISNGNNAFDSYCRAAGLAPGDKCEHLLRVLESAAAILVLESFEKVPPDHALHDFLKRAVQTAARARFLITAQTLPSWPPPDAQVHIARGLDIEPAMQLMSQWNVPDDHRLPIYNAVQGNPRMMQALVGRARRLGLDAALARSHEIARGEFGPLWDACSDSEKALWQASVVAPAPLTNAALNAAYATEDFDGALDGLTTCFVLERDPATQRFSHHPLVRALGEERLRKNTEFAAAVKQRLTAHFAQYADAHSKDFVALRADQETLLAAAGWAADLLDKNPLFTIASALDDWLYYSGLWSDLLDLLKAAYQASKQADERILALFAHNYGIALQQTGNYDDAESLYKRSLEIKERIGDEPGRAATLHQLGRIAELRGNYDDAERLYKQGLQIKERIGDEPGRAATLHQLGAIAQERGNYDDAERLYKQSLDIRQRIGDEPGIAQSLHQLGNTALLRGKYDDAESLYEQGLEIEKRIRDEPGRAQTLHQVGMIAQLRGKDDDAESLYKQSLEIAHRIGDQRGRARTIHQLGMIAQARGNYDDAESLYKQSLEIKQRIGDQPGRAASLHQLGMIAEKRGNLVQADRLVSESLQIVERIASPDAQTARRTLARIRQKSSKPQP